MRKFQETEKVDSPAARALQRRINLSNRPRLNVGIKRLDEVSSTLAHSGADRARFTEDPTRYLQAQSVPVSSCELVKTSGRAMPQQTSEVSSVTAVICCTMTSQQSACSDTTAGCMVIESIAVYVIGPRLYRFFMIGSHQNEWELDSAVL